MKNERNIYSTRAAAMRAREIERARREKRKSASIIVGSIALIMVACIAAGVFIYGAFVIQKSNTNPASTAATTQVLQNKDNAPLSNGSTASKQQTSAQKGNTSSQKAQDTNDSNIRIVNGNRTYIDTKRQAPAGTGTPYHFYANGKTSYGFDWTYKADNSNVKVACNYDFTKQQYDFIIYGVTPGTTHITLYYNTDDNTQAPAQLTLNVDKNLNVAKG